MELLENYGGGLWNWLCALCAGVQSSSAKVKMVEIYGAHKLAQELITN